MNKVGLFIPCYIDQFFPEVGIASLELLEKHNCTVVFPADQTCCGQPMANSGMEQENKNIYNRLAHQFEDCDYVVAPSPSCVHHIRDHYDIVPQTESIVRLRQNTYDIAEFLYDILNVRELKASFRYKVGLHKSCHGLRGLHLAKPSELMRDIPSRWNQLLDMVDGIEIVELNRADECCGFGGTFAVAEEAVSVKMGKDRIADHLANKAEVITSGDMSCLMHLQGIARRQKTEVKIVHLVNILNGDKL